jgi:uncharacterized protein (DUF1800 family)
MRAQPELRFVPANSRGSQPRPTSCNLVPGFTITPTLLARLSRFAMLLLLFAAVPLRAQKLDLNTNGVSDIWEYRFNAVALNPNIDSDGDGVINRLEAIAGTDPLDPASVPRITLMAYTATNFSVTLPAALGKLYQLQSTTSLTNAGGPVWTNEMNVIPRSGTTVSLSATTGGSAKYFRISYSDVDTDGDGLNDWEEYQLGLDPFQPASNGQLDVNGQPIGDYAYAASRLASQNIVTIIASDPAAFQPDVNAAVTGPGEFTIIRGGFPLNSITVNLAPAAPGPGIAVTNQDYVALPPSVDLPAGVSAQTVALIPLANTNLVTPVVAKWNLQPGLNYTVGTPSSASVVISPSASALGPGLVGNYYSNSSTIYTNSANFNSTNLFLTRTDPSINFIWYTNTVPNLSNGNYTVRWTGQIVPQYSETYFFDALTDDGTKVFVNDLLVCDRWATGSADSIGTINLQAGIHYNIRMDYMNSGGSANARLYWYSTSQPKQVIPPGRFYTNSGPAAPAAIVSAQTAVGFLGQPFSYTVISANSGSNFTATGLPPGLGINSTNGLISGTPSLAGTYQVNLAATNSGGIGASILSIQIFDTGSSVVREVWTNVPGTTIAAIPVNTTAQLTNYLGTLEGLTDYGDNYAERIRGFLTAPATANFYFWLAGSDAAELWISNDAEPANKVRRAVTSGTGVHQWTNSPAQRSPWLSMVAGQRYYVEILHKAGVGAGDNWSVGWLQDPTGTNTAPSGVVPGYVLSRYFQTPPIYVPGTLYTADMLAQAGAISSGVGSATLRVSADGSQAILKYSYSGLTGPITSEHIHSDSYQGKPSQIIFDIDTTAPQPDGSRIWNIVPAPPLSVADIQEIIRENKAYINLHTAAYPGGEINGHFTLAVGSQAFTPPPAPPAWTDDHTTTNGAVRFLNQSTFGASPTDIAYVQTNGYDAWISNQFTLPISQHLPKLLASPAIDPVATTYPSTQTFNTWWQQSITAPDQLRQRVAFALSEIMVVSDSAGTLNNNGPALSGYYDVLLTNAFGNFRQLLEDVTTSPAMGLYLDMRGNQKGSIINGTHPNENYAREILQLFSIGLNRMWPDGTLVMSSADDLVPTYDQSVIEGFAATFTGWNYYQTNLTNGRAPTGFGPAANYTNGMTLVPNFHDLGAKRVLDNIILPAAQGTYALQSNTNYDLYGQLDLDQALDSIFNNQNVGPFICRQLIQRLVTSNPSRDYLYRVVSKFNDNGSGVRGDMKSVVQAILLDYEARSSNLLSVITYGKQREPLLRVTAPARAFPPPTGVTGTYNQAGTRTITVTTAVPHKMNNNDTVFLSFVDTSGNAAPPTQSYQITVTGANTFTFNAPGLSGATYGQTNSTITVTNSAHGLLAADSVYLVFNTGGASNGVYQVLTVPGANSFTVAAVDSTNRTGSGLFPKWTGGGYVQVGTNVTVSLTGAHGMNPGDPFCGHTVAPTNIYNVATVPDPTHFTFFSTVSSTNTDDDLVPFPLVPPPLNRFGNVSAGFSTWSLGYTDLSVSSTGSSSLLQSPLNAPTVFNFYFPDYKFPGILASAGLTTPEFQLTSDTGVALQMNFLQGGILGTNSNVNGLSSFTGGNGSIVLDFSPWMNTNYTANAGIPALIDSLNSLLTGGQLSGGAKTNIINYVASANFAYTATNPTPAQMSSRIRAVVHLIVVSPDFTIQR